MFIYVMLTVPAAILAYLLPAIRTKKSPDVVYSPLDKICRVTNIVLLLIYLIPTALAMFLGMVSAPIQSGSLAMTLLGWFISILIGSPALFVGAGLGLSAAWRKKGKSVQSFAVQFLGFVGILLSFGLYGLFVGSLLQTLN